MAATTPKRDTVRFARSMQPTSQDSDSHGATSSVPVAAIRKRLRCFPTEFYTALRTGASPLPSMRKPEGNSGDLIRWWIVALPADRQAAACAAVFSIADSHYMKARSSFLFWIEG